MDHGAQCFGIRVVAVVENGRAADLDHLAALVAGGERRDRLHRGIEIDARFKRHGETGQGIRCVVRAQHVQREVALMLPRAIANVQAIEIFGDRENLRVGAWAAAEIHHAAVKIAAKLRGVGIVAIQEGDAVRGQRCNQFEFGAGNAGLALFEVLNVRRAHVGDHAPVGRGDARQGGDLAGVIHAHLDDGDFVLRREAQQLQGQAEAVVEIALGLEDVELCAQRRGHGFLGGGFSRRAGDGDDEPAPLAANMRGQRLQREERIFGDEKRTGERGIGQGSDARARHDGGDGSALERGGHKVMAIEALAAHRKE